MSILTTDKLKLELPDIARRLKNAVLPNVDAVVGVATGGVAFASMVAFWLEKPLHIIHLNYRDENNKPRHQQPTLLKPFASNSIIFNKGLPFDVAQGEPLANSKLTDTSANHILLVDDVSVTGATLETARKLLPDYTVTTFVLKGKADLVLYPEVRSCILLPWRDV
jgi:hypoxanthine phosphoribosyltransferase